MIYVGILDVTPDRSSARLLWMIMLLEDHQSRSELTPDVRWQPERPCPMRTNPTPEAGPDLRPRGLLSRDRPRPLRRRDICGRAPRPVPRAVHRPLPARGRRAP